MSSKEIRVVANYGPAHDSDLWSWTLKFGCAASGKVAIEWKTFTVHPAVECERTLRSRAVPAWAEEVVYILSALDFRQCPPTANWGPTVDGPGIFSVGLRANGAVDDFSVTYSPLDWCGPNEGTKSDVERLFGILDKVAREVHSSGPDSDL